MVHSPLATLPFARHPIRRTPASRTGLLRSERGVAAMEMAFALPVLLALLMGILSYGEWFLTAHTVQQAANDAARSAIAGLTQGERTQLANVKMNTVLASSLNPTRATLSASEINNVMTVSIRYDASNDPMLHVAFVAPPSPIIQRSAAISLGGM
jgi:Flp pilus assembly protein TadG